jgi:hypothetical protein
MKQKQKRGVGRPKTRKTETIAFRVWAEAKPEIMALLAKMDTEQRTNFFIVKNGKK